MIVNFAKSLDRPLEILTLRGRWLMVFIIFAGASVLLGIVAGVVVSSGVGISAAIVLVVLSFLLCLSLQGKTSYRQIARQRASSKVYSHVRYNETISRILLPDPFAGKRSKACDGRTCMVDGETKELCRWCSYRKGPEEKL